MENKKIQLKDTLPLWLFLVSILITGIFFCFVGSVLGMREKTPVTPIEVTRQVVVTRLVREGDQPAATTTRTPLPSFTPFPTYTSSPTYTPSPTYTRGPTYTPGPTYTSTPKVFPVVIQPGTYIIGEDIQPGLYIGHAGEDTLESCYWARLRDFSGKGIIYNDNSVGQFYIQVAPSDFALETHCQLRYVGK
jgi:hypothetical protein